MTSSIVACRRVIPEAMTRAVDEDVFQSWLAERYGSDFVSESLDQLAQQFVAAIAFDAERVSDLLRGDTESLGDLCGKSGGIVTVHVQAIAADRSAEFFGTAECDE